MKLQLLSMLVLVFALPLLALSARADTVSTDFANASAFAVLGATTVTNTGASGGAFKASDFGRIIKADPDLSDCNDQSWYGPEHDSACRCTGAR